VAVVVGGRVAIVQLGDRVRNVFDVLLKIDNWKEKENVKTVLIPGIKPPVIILLIGYEQRCTYSTYCSRLTTGKKKRVTINFPEFNPPVIILLYKLVKNVFDVLLKIDN
jgi:hypothetical protein